MSQAEGKFIKYKAGVGDNTLPPETDFQKLLDRLCEKSESQKPFYNPDQTVLALEFFSTAIQAAVDRLMRVDILYDTMLNPLTEVWSIYLKGNGSTVIKTVTFSHQWTNGNWVKTETAVS